MTGLRAHLGRRRVAALLWAGTAAAGLGWAPPAAAADQLQLALLIDTSGSIRRLDQPARNQLAADLAHQVAGGEVTVYTFDDQPHLLLPRTKDPAAVAQAVAGLSAAGQFTALNDAIFDAARYLSDGPAGKHAIVVLTDGLDENSALVPEDGIQEARRQRIPIFSVGIGNVQERYLRRIAKLSGGEYFPPKSPAAAIVERVVALTPVSQPVAPPAVTVGLPAAAAAAARPAAAAPGIGATAPILAGVAFAVLIALFALGFVLLRRPAPARPAPAAAGSFGAPLGGELDDDSTLVGRMSDLHAEGSTLVLTLKPLLHVTRGPNVGKFFEVGVESATSIGRAKGNEVVLDDHAVSSQHCRIRPQGGVWELIDLKSTNGTFVNERKVARTHLTAGDTIKLGETILQFRMDHMKG